VAVKLERKATAGDQKTYS